MTEIEEQLTRENAALKNENERLMAENDALKKRALPDGWIGHPCGLIEDVPSVTTSASRQAGTWATIDGVTGAIIKIEGE